MFQFDLRITLADSDLRKVNRMCELAGVQVRYPFLDDALAEFSARISPAILMQGGRLRAFYKHAIRGFLPDAIINKKKHGFGIPALEYVRDHSALKDLFCDVISGLKKRHWFSTLFIDDVVERLRNGETRCYASVAWDLAMLELWLQSREPFNT